jgi:outer membrane protein, heavy metal efflux system
VVDASATHENARLVQRAHALGESDLQAVLLARRQAVEAALAALQARVDALRARYRLLVDAHLIWDLADE